MWFGHFMRSRQLNNNWMNVSTPSAWSRRVLKWSVTEKEDKIKCRKSVFQIFSSFAYLKRVVVHLIVIFLNQAISKGYSRKHLNGNGEISCTWLNFCDSSLLFFSQRFSILLYSGGLYFGLLGSSFRADVKCQSNSAAPEANAWPACRL